MLDKNSAAIFLKDYKLPSYLIHTIYLIVSLHAEYALITAQLNIEKNPISEDDTNTLILDGQEQELLSIQLNNKPLDAACYQQTSDSLIICNLNATSFNLLITTKIKPQANTELSGLYKSGNMFCTQCEAEGFRRITYYLDRPDVMAKFTCKIIADKDKYPVLLSNGNLIEKGDIDSKLHYTIWQDPFKKPSYLFALVAGDLIGIEDHFLTKSSRLVTLKLYVERENLAKTQHAIEALKKAMTWDEKVYDREYDLDIYMIVAVNDFNMGAMENKGLNLFNAKYVLADPQIATDQDFAQIDAVIGHEYFHNWSGNRVTCRDWFQLSLKEGFTVFREQQFSAYLAQSAATRIEQVKLLIAKQFAEDASSTAHPVIPESYQEINNFYTLTIYEKGAEIIRMLHTILGPEVFKQGTNLYFSRYDGHAATIENFISALEEASQQDFSQFRLWYNQVGTPKVSVTEKYDHATQEYSLNFIQDTPKPMHIPIKIALFSEKGCITEKTLQLTKQEQKFNFFNIAQEPVASLLRDFSAPIKLTSSLTKDKHLFILKHDPNEFSKWYAAQQIMQEEILQLVAKYNTDQQLTKPNNILQIIQIVLENTHTSDLVRALLISLPTLEEIINILPQAEPDKIHTVLSHIVLQISLQFKDLLYSMYQQLNTKDRYNYNSVESGKRKLKNVILHYLIKTNEQPALELAEMQYKNTDNMTDRFGVLQALTHLDNALREELLADFYIKWQHEPLVVNKWLQVQAVSEQENTLSRVQALLMHPAFKINNPNNVYALIGGFGGGNLLNFHAKDGSGYKFLREQILVLDALNPQVAARMIIPFTKFASYDLARQQMMQQNLRQLAANKQLSKNIKELIQKTLS